MTHGRCVRRDVSPARMALFTFCIVRRDSAKRHICGGCAPWRVGYDPQIRTRSTFLYDASTPKLHHPIIPMFTRSEVIVLTDTPTNKPISKPTDSSNIQRYSLCYDVVG